MTFRSDSQGGTGRDDIMPPRSCFEPLLHPRLRGECFSLLDAGFHRQAAFEAMKTVELTLRDYGGTEPKLYGVRLVRRLFDERRGFFLQLPLDQDQQVAGRMLFEGAFRYYRNYSAHDGSRITPVIAVRIMILASELLEMIGASERRIEGTEELEQFVTAYFQDHSSFLRALRVLDGEWFPDDVVDGFFEALAEAGVTEEQFRLLTETGLLDAEETQTLDPEFETVTRFEVTSAGHNAIEWAQNQVEDR